MSDRTINQLPLLTELRGDERMPAQSPRLTGQFSIDTLSQYIGGQHGFIPVTRQIIAGPGLDGGGTMAGNVTLSLEPSGAMGGTYGSAVQIPQLVIDALGRVTSIVNTPIHYTENWRRINTTAPLAGGGDLTSDLTLYILADGISTALLADGAVTTPKLADNAVTNAKMADDSVNTAELVNGSVTAPKLAPGVIDTPILVDNAVTNPKLADMAQATVKGRAAGAGTGDPQDLTQAQLVGVLNTAAVTLTNPLTVNLTTAGSAFNLTSTDAGPGEGPTVTFIRDSASPAANDLLSVLRWYGRDSAANLQEYGNFYGQIINPTSGAETSHFSLTTMAAGVYSSQMVWDNGVGFGGYGAVGGGTINGGGYYVNSTKLADGAGFNMAWIAPGSITGSMIADRTITDADIALASVWGSNVLMDNSVGMEKLTDMPNATVKMRPAGYGAGDPLDINQTDALVNMANNAVGMDIQWYHRPIWHQQDGAAISNPTGGYGAAQIQSAGVGPAAMLAFHRVGSFAAYFGLETDNTWRVGGWSYGNVSYCVFHQGFQASKADMEARSADYFGFSPARAIWHDGVSKSWVLCNTAGGVGAPTHGVGSMTDGGDGYMALNFMYGMVSPYPACQITCLDNYVSTVRASAISQYTIQAQNYNLQFSTVMDPTSYYMFTVHGQIQ